MLRARRIPECTQEIGRNQSTREKLWMTDLFCESGGMSQEARSFDVELMTHAS